MNKLKVFVSVMVALLATVTSFASTAADYTDIVYAKDVKVTLGGQVEIPIYIKNPSYPVKSFEFDMVLPDGLSFAMDGSTQVYNVCSDFSKWSVVVGTKAGAATNTTHAIVSYQQPDAATVQIDKGSDVEVFTITLQVDANTTAGTKALIMKNIMLAEDANNEHKIVSGNETISSDVNVQRAETVQKLGEGYALEITPFTAVDGDNTISFKYKSATDIKNISFDVQLPKGMYFIDDEDWDKSNVKTNLVASVTGTPTTTTTFGEGDYPSTATIKVAGAYSTKSKKYINAATEQTVLATISADVLTQQDVVDYEWTGNVMSEGLSEIKITNISLEDINGNTYTGDNVTSVFFGQQTNKDPILYGDITDASSVTAAIPDDATSVDISQATATDDVVDAIVEDAQTKNVNAIVYAPSTYEGTKDNVVVSDEDGNLSCSSFKMADGNTMNIPASFKAAEAKYSRTFDTEHGQNWGTICLPYAVKSDETVAYYNITNATSGVLTLEKYETLPANTPALVKKLSGTAIASNATNVAVGGELKDLSGVVTMKGVYADNQTITETPAYYIMNNKFWKSAGSFKMNAFRAYFTVDAALAKNASFTISEDDVTAINALIGESETKISEIYGEDGVRCSDLQKGLNIIKLSNGKTQKIMIK